MIKSVKIKNFQAHKAFELELSKTVTTIIGPSDTGKSSVIRALRWLAFNQPGGSSFVRWNKKSASVSVKLDDAVIVRSKGVGKNIYKVIRDGSDIVLEAVGKSVPDNVAAQLRLSPLNFQEQYDSPFWLSNSAGEVARGLNKLVNLQVIDKVLACLSRRVSVCKTQLKLLKGQLSECKSKLLARAWVVDAEAELASISSTLRRVQKCASAILDLATMLDELKKTEKEHTLLVRRRKMVQAMLADIEVLSMQMAKNGKFEKRVDELGVVVDELRQVLSERTKLGKEIEVMKEEYGLLLGKECPACGQLIQ